MGSAGAGQAAYDVENRLTYMPPPTAGGTGTYYGYDPQNKRVWIRKPNGVEDVHLYGLNGRLLVKLNTPTEYAYLGNKLAFKKVPTGGSGILDINAMEDRLGSVGSYFPYGTDRTTSTTEDIKFATYHRDATGLDYANQRYYDSRMGRFLTPDPYIASGGPADPGSWNRYAYTRGDPVNRNDPFGTLDSTPTDGNGCVSDPYGISYLMVDASNPCPPGMVPVGGPSAGGSRTRLQDLFEAVDLVRHVAGNVLNGNDPGTYRIMIDPDLSYWLNNIAPAAPVVLGAGGWVVLERVLVVSGGVGALTGLGRWLYGEGQRWRSEAKSLREAEAEYEDLCGHKFPNEKRSQRHEKIRGAKRNTDGGMVGQEEMLDIMLNLAPCDDPDEVN